MDNESLLLSSMRSLVALLQKCQTGKERLDAAEARAAGWAAEREELLKSLAAKEAMLRRSKGGETQNAHLSSELDDARIALVRQEEDLRTICRTNKRLISQQNMAKGELEMALTGKAAELEYALTKQETELKEKYLAEHDATMGEEAGRLAADYKAQLPGLRDRAWELRWKAALKKVGISRDNLLYRDPHKFPSSDSALYSIVDSPLILGLSSQAPLEVNAAPKVPPEAPPTASAMHEASSAPEVVPVVSIVSKTVLAGPKESAARSDAGAPAGIDCNVEAICRAGAGTVTVPCVFGFAAKAGAGTELRVVVTLTELPSRGGDFHRAPNVFGFATKAGTRTELRAVGTLTKLPSRGGDCHQATDVFGFAAKAGAGTELRAVGTLTELPSRGGDCHRAPDVFGFTVVAGAGTKLMAVGTLTELASRGGDCHRAPNVFGFAVVTGAGTELRTVGTLTELPSRGGDCHRALRKLALLLSCIT
ncbi:hypothetical protein MRB53_033324 [Persea americana]|uniref:Uncharacterized protein n=1 Tax=Persea americana TaxID=3435 RepID=A0ACC2KVJ5_PERAE|nr:hypothetical protein MRB53_033324 [Persea americana]